MAHRIAPMLPSTPLAALLATLLMSAAPAAQAQATPGTQIGFLSVSGWHQNTGWAHSETLDPSAASPNPQTGAASVSFLGWDPQFQRSVVAEASFAGRAAMGSLQGAAATKAEGFVNVNAGISASGHLMFWDGFTVSGTPGQGIEVAWQASLHGVRACTGETDLAPFADARLRFSFATPGGTERGDAWLHGCGENTLNRNGVMTLLPGDRVQVFAELNVFAKNGDAMNAGNTARLYFDVLTPGASLVSDSGHNYSISAVPEPAAWLLFSGGAALLCLRRSAAAVRERSASPR